MHLFLYVRCRLWWLVTKSSLNLQPKLIFILLFIIIINEASESAVIIVNNVVIVNQVLYCQKWTKSAERIIHLLVSWMQSMVTNCAQKTFRIVRIRRGSYFGTIELPMSLIKHPACTNSPPPLAKSVINHGFWSHFVRWTSKTDKISRKNTWQVQRLQLCVLDYACLIRSCIHKESRHVIDREKQWFPLIQQIFVRWVVKN